MKFFAPLAFLLLIGVHISVMANELSPDVLKDLAPSGRLRVAINFGNPVLAQKDPATDEPRGISADLARELGRQLGVPVDFISYPGAGQVFDALATGAWDVCFLAVDPVRAAGIDFTAPYVLIEGTYLVPSNSSLRAIDDVDRDGVRVAVGRGSAYDLFLTRALKHAALVRAPTSAEALALFGTDRLEAAAGVRQPLVAFAETHPEVRIIDGRFMAIEQAVGTPKGRSGAGLRYLREFVEKMKATGFVAGALKASGQADATVAPATVSP